MSKGKEKVIEVVDDELDFLPDILADPTFDQGWAKYPTRSDPTRPDPKNFGFGSDRVVKKTWSGEFVSTRSDHDRIGWNPIRSENPIGLRQKLKKIKPKPELHIDGVMN